MVQMTSDPSVGTMPALAPSERLEMPARGVRGVPRTRPRERADWSAVAARLVAFVGALAITVALTRAMASAFTGDLPYGLGGLFVGLFALTVGWTAFSATSAIAGLLGAHRRRWPERAPEGRVALVMPVYNEDPAMIAAGLAAMARGVRREDPSLAIEVVVLSDTNRPDAWARETTAIAWLRRELVDVAPVWYRRRARNTAKKSGNVEDFVVRAGGRYESFVVLDADSLMEPSTLVTLARRMAGDERLGLLQTAPRLLTGEGPLARAQAFAGAVYGDLVARGVAAWSGPDGNFWGHNAIIRTRAFAASCGLPRLDGAPPFGGPIQSHDFAEAAWLRRAGWSVRLDPLLLGTHEEGPPTLLDLAARDRRWMQGNFQHARLLGASGLAPVSRFHLLNGILGYAASPLWLALLVVGGAVTAVARRAEHRYFAEPHQLTPDWPRFDEARMLALFVAAFALLLLPKALGVATAALRSSSWIRAGRVVVGALFETLISALVAPVSMLTQTRQALEILRGRDSGWSPQSRAGATPWAVAWRRHLGHTVVGLASAAGLWLFARELLPWAAPVFVGLVLSAPLSWASGRAGLGRAIERAGLLDAGVEPPRMARDRDGLRPAVERELRGASLARVLTDAASLRRHLECIAGEPAAEGDVPERPWLAAREKVERASGPAALAAWLEADEALALLGDANLLRAAAVAGAPGEPARAS